MPITEQEWCLRNIKGSVASAVRGGLRPKSTLETIAGLIHYAQCKGVLLEQIKEAIVAGLKSPLCPDAVMVEQVRRAFGVA